MTNEKIPKFGETVFSCPYCHIAAKQKFDQMCRVLKEFQSGTCSVNQITNLFTSECENCKRDTIWYNNKILFPSTPLAPLPNEDMPEDVKIDYLEAREILERSPRASAALLRLALQKLMPHIGEKGKNINHDIASLVQKGLDRHIQQSLDIVRIIGNEAVHPGQIDLKDDIGTAQFMFDLINLIVENQISHPKRINKVYKKLPQDKILGIFNRDKK